MRNICRSLYCMDFKSVWSCCCLPTPIEFFSQVSHFCSKILPECALQSVRLKNQLVRCSNGYSNYCSVTLRPLFGSSNMNWPQHTRPPAFLPERFLFSRTFASASWFGARRRLQNGRLPGGRAGGRAAVHAAEIGALTHSWRHIGDGRMTC